MSQSVVRLMVQDKTLIIEINGKVDENFIFPSVKFSLHSELILDLKNLTAINSVGIRTWIHWNALIPADLKIKYRNCSQVAVEHILTFAGFLPSGAVIESAYVPYFCDPCDLTTDLLVIKNETTTPDNINIPDNIECQYCRNLASLDADKDDYIQIFFGM